MNLEAAWIAHLGPVPTLRFPREVAFPVQGVDRFTRVLVDAAYDYVGLLHRLAESRNTYTGVYSLHQKREGLAHVAYADIDAETPRDAAAQADAMVRTTYARYGKFPRLYVSGAKGFALYWFFPEHRISGRAIREWILTLAAEAGVTLQDTSVLGDTERVSRLPYTYNFNAVEKVGRPLLCVPVDPRWDADVMLQESREPTHFLMPGGDIFPEIAAELREIDAALPPEPTPGSFTLDLTKADETVRFFAEKADRVRDGRHRILGMILVPWCVASGKNAEETYRFCAAWIRLTRDPPHDYREHILANHEWARRKAWRPWSLDSFFKKHPELLTQFFETPTTM